MTRRGHSVVFAALLLVTQLLFAVISAGAMAHDGSRHCDGCPTAGSSSLSHTAGSHHGMPGGDEGGSHCAKHCSHGDTGNSGCSPGCVMPGGGHCGTHASPALIATASIHPAILTGPFGGDRRSVLLPDSPLFDFLRPPTRA